MPLTSKEREMLAATLQSWNQTSKMHADNSRKIEQECMHGFTDHNGGWEEVKRLEGKAAGYHSAMTSIAPVIASIPDMPSPTTIEAAQKLMANISEVVNQMQSKAEEIVAAQTKSMENIERHVNYLIDNSNVLSELVFKCKAVLEFYAGNFPADDLGNWQERMNEDEGDKARAMLETISSTLVEILRKQQQHFK